MSDNPTQVYTVVKLSPMRRIIAARMTEAKRTIPHFRCGAEIQMDTLLALRRKLQERNPDDKLSLNDLLIKACAGALLEVPTINVQWVDGDIHQYHSADIAVVVAVEGGLATPIVRSADAKGVWEISREVKELAARANRHQLKMNEIVGGTFSISNLGMYGVDQFDAIINPPQCAILAVGCVKPAVVLAADAKVGSAAVMRLTLSVDHRAIDGAAAGLFLTSLKRRLEQPEQHGIR